MQVQVNPAELAPSVARDGLLGLLTDMSLVAENLVTLYPEPVVTSIPLDHMIHARHSSVFGKKILNYPTGCDQIKVELLP